MPDATRTADVLTAEGIALGRRGDLRDALVWFDAALAKDPKHVGARYNQGVTFLSLDRPLEAERAFLAFVELRPDDVSAHIAIARIQGSTGRPDAALASLQRAVKGGFDDPATLKDSAFSDLKRDLRFLALEATVAQRAAAAGRPVADEDFARIGADLNYGGTSVPGLKLPGIRNAGECKQQADGSLSCTPEPDAP